MSHISRRIAGRQTRLADTAGCSCQALLDMRHCGLTLSQLWDVVRIRAGGKVNRLVKALIERPQVIELMAGQGDQRLDRQEDPRFGRLLDALDDALFSESELRRVRNDPYLRQRLGEGYLPTISAPEWDRALSLTENRAAINSGWWTVMVAGVSGHFGLTVPQDDSRAELVALFTGPLDSAQVLVYDPTLGMVREVTGGPHCGPPSRGDCFEGSCHSCKAYEVYDETSHLTGIKCMCSHQAE